MTKKPHVHAELIKAWADGAEIEYRSHETIQWEPIFKGWSWDNVLIAEYRIKPQAPKPDDVVYKTNIRWDKGWQWVDTTSSKSPNLKVTFDYETGEIKSAEVLK